MGLALFPEHGIISITNPIFTMSQPLTTHAIQFDEVTTLEGFRALEPEWNALLQRSAADTIYLTWEYLTTWWEVFGKTRELWILTARDEGGKLIGLAPLMVGPGNRMRQFLHELTFIGGHGDSTCECQDFIVEKGREEEVVRMFLGKIKNADHPKWNFLAFPITVADSLTMTLAGQSLEKWGALRLRDREAPFCAFTGSWEEYLQSRSSKFRSTVRNRIKKIQTQHRTELKVGGQDLALDEALLHVVKLSSSRWGDDMEAFHSLKFLEFHRRLIPRLAARGWVLLLVLMVDGAPAAGRYDYLYGGKVWGFQGGWDPAFARLSIGLVMNALTFQWAIQHHGITEYDFGADTSRYKSEWSNGSRLLKDIYMAHPQSLPARVMLFVHELQKKGRKLEADAVEDEPMEASTPLTLSSGIPQ